MVTKAIAAKLVAKPGKEAEVEALLTSAWLANQEPLTVTWYAVKFNENTFGIFDTFAADEGRDAHLNGQIAAALMAKADDLLAEPPPDRQSRCPRRQDIGGRPSRFDHCLRTAGPSTLLARGN